MRFMIIVKATKDSEAGVMPSEQLLAEMGKFNEELVKAGVLLAGEGLQTQLQRRSREILGNHTHFHRRSLCRDEGADCRLLALAGEIEGRSYRMRQALPESGG
jgi:hypothetical protein